MRLSPHAEYARTATAYRIHAKYAERAAKSTTWNIATYTVGLLLFGALAVSHLSPLYIAGSVLFALTLAAEMHERRTQTEKARKHNATAAAFEGIATGTYPHDKEA